MSEKWGDFEQEQSGAANRLRLMNLIIPLVLTTALSVSVAIAMGGSILFGIMLAWVLNGPFTLLYFRLVAARKTNRSSFLAN
ncbi:hypothetical protein AAD018_000715 [Aestuariibius insulae]|uniref:hypothetical protein n=1 Tax=Aestuariibius insulae TaxID=2058287 RepID=UPI00345E7AE0